MLVNGIEKQWSGWYIAFFFLLHYGIFIMVQLIIFNAVSEFSTAWINPVRLLSDLLNHLGTQGRMLLLINFGIMLIGTATQFVKESEYKTKGLIAMMMEPYQRIFVQQFVLILGAFLIKNNWGLAFMLLFMVARFAFGGVFVQVMEKLKQPKPSIKTP